MPRRSRSTDDSAAGVSRRRRRAQPVVAGLAVATATCTWLAASPAVAATTVVGLWSFDEAAGATVAADSSGFGNAGQLRGNVVTGLAGRSGNAYSFAAAGSWVEVASTAQLNPLTADFSYSADIKISTAPGSGVTYDVIRKGLAATPGGEFKLEVVTGGQIKCTAKDAARVRAVVKGPKHNYADGQWHRVGCSRVGTRWSAVVDGLTVSKTIALGRISNDKNLSIGSKYGQQDATPGLVDEVQLSIDSP